MADRFDAIFGAPQPDPRFDAVFGAGNGFADPDKLKSQVQLDAEKELTNPDTAKQVADIRTSDALTRDRNRSRLNQVEQDKADAANAQQTQALAGGGGTIAAADAANPDPTTASDVWRSVGSSAIEGAGEGVRGLGNWGAQVDSQITKALGPGAAQKILTGFGFAPAANQAIADVGQKIIDTGEALAPPKERQDQPLNRTASTIGGIAGLIATSAVAPEAVTPEIIGQGFDQINQQIKDSGGNTGTGAALTAETAGGVAIGALQATGLGVLTRNLSLPIKNAIARGIASVAIKSGADAATFAAMDIVTNFASQLGIDPNTPVSKWDEALKGSGQAAATGGIAGAVLATVLGHYGRLRTGKSVGAPADNSIFGPNADNNSYGPAQDSQLGTPITTDQNGNSWLAGEDGRPQKFASHKEAAAWAVRNGLGHAFERGVLPDGSIGLTPVEQFHQPNASPLDVSTTQDMQAGAPLVTPEDHSSPLPTDLIQQGKGAMAADLELGQHNDILHANGAPPVGSDVAVTGGAFNGQGKVLGAFSVGDQANPQHGIRIGMDDGSTFEELFHDIKNGGLSIQQLVDKYLPETAANAPESAAELPSTDLPAAAPLPVQRGGNAAGQAHLPADVVQGLVARGIPEVAARAAAAGTVAEAGGKETAVNTTSGAIGLGQWLGSRKDALIARYGPNPTREQQLDFLAYELKGGDPGGKAVLSATNEADALHAYITQFMRPAKGHETDSDLQRGAAALGGGSVGTPSSATSDTSTSTNDQAEEPIQFDKLQVPEEEAPAAPAKASSFDLQPIKEAAAADKVHIDAHEQDGSIYLNSVKRLLGSTPGAGATAIKALLEQADQLGLPVRLMAHALGDERPQENLVGYYRNLGFHETSPDSSEMVREPQLGSEEQRTATQPTPTITPFGEAKPGDVVNEHGQTLLRADFKTPQEAGLWRSSNKVVGTVEGYDANGNTRYAVVSKTAPPSEDRYTPFDPALGSLGIPRAEMPQIKSEDRSAFVQFARGQGVDYKEEEVAPTDLKPSQAEYSPAKVEQAIGFTGGDRAILVSSDNYVVDGHHQWVAALRKGDQSVRVIRLDAPIRDVLKTAHEFPSSQSTDKPQSIILPNGKERSLVNKAALGPLFADPATDLEKYAILNAASEGRHRWKDAITSHSNWMMREGYATPVKDKAGSLQLTDEGHAELARVSAAREQAISAQIAASKPFEPMDHIPAMKKLVGETNISLGNLPAIANKLGLQPDEAHKVLGKRASMPNSGIFQTKGRPASGKKKAAPPRFQRVGKRTTPLHLMEFVRSIGGVRNDEGHDLRNTGDIARFPGVINNKSGMSLDRLGEALHEAGYFNDRNQSDPTKRPDTAEIIDLLERGSHAHSRVYANDDLTRVQDLQEQQSNADDEERHREDLRDVARESGLDVTEAEIDHALHNYVAYGESHEYAIAAAVRDAAAETLERDAELLGNDFYAKIAGELYEGEHAEQRSGSDAETVAQRQAQPTGEAGQGAAGQEPAGAERPAHPAEQAQHPEQAKVESAPADELAPRPTDTRDHLQRKADERLIPAKEQKPVGSDGGLFDTPDTTGDLFAAENPLEDRLRGILDAIESPHGRYGMASVQWQKEIQPRDDILYELGQKPLDASRTAEDEYRQYLGKDRAAAIEQAAKDLAAGKIDRSKALATITDADLRKVQDGRQAAQDEFAYGRTKELADAGNEQAKKALATLDAKKAAPTATQSELKDVGEKIGSARKEDDLAAPRASAVDAPRAPFYSALEKSVEANPTKRASAEQWLATLKRAPGVKQDELDWSGVEDWLKMQEGPVDKEALLGVVRDGGIKVDEVVLSGDPNVEPMDVADATQRQAEVEADAALGEEATDEQRRDWIDSNWGRIQDQQEAMLQQEAGDAQFQGWSSDPSNKTYRELLITLPLGEGGNPQRAPATHWDQEAVVAHARFMDKTDAEGKRVLFIEEVQSDWHQKGRDQGYEQKADEATQVVARQKADAARDEYMGAAKAAFDYYTQDNAIPGNLNVDTPAEAKYTIRWLYENGGLAGTHEGAALLDKVDSAKSAWDLAEHEHNVASGAVSSGIPDAPFKATWPALVMKRMIVWAAEHGYDKVAWTTGEEQAERYNLASTVDKIDVQKVSGEYRVRFGERQRIESLIVERGLARWDSRGNYAGAVVMTADQVSEVFGKDLGGRMMTEAGAAKNGEMVTLEGNGLKLGGEGMKAFYDRNLVNITNDLIKKYGGKVEPVPFAMTFKEAFDRAGNEPVDLTDHARAVDGIVNRRNPGFTITNKLREAATGGFPLFNVGGVRVRFSAEQMQQFAKELPAALKALGVDDRIALRLGVSADLAHQGTQGQYWNRVVTIAMDKADDPYRVLVHEVGGHGLKALGLYTPTEWKILTDGAWADKDIRAWAQRNYPGKSEEYQKEEAASEWLADRAAAARDVKNDKSFMGRMLHRLIQFISAVRRLARKIIGKGEEAGDIARRVFSGEVGSRPTGFGEPPRDRTGFGNKGLLPDENGKRIQQELGPRSSVTDSTTPAAPQFDPETEKRWQEANGLGVHGPGLIANAKVGLQHFVEGWARHYEHLPNSARFADVTQQLRKLEGAPEAAYEKVVRGLTQLVGKLTPEEYDVMKRKAVVDDLMWEADREHQLPFGFTPESLREARANLDSIAQTMPKVTEALRQRKLANRQLADALVESGVLRSDQIKNPAYYRHQVLDYARAQVAAAKNGETMIVGGKSVRVRMPWWAKREGSTLDINSNLLEAEADWMLKAHTDIQTAKTLNWIKESDHNIRDQLRTRAKGENDEGYAKALLTNEEAAKQDGKLRGMTKRGFDVVKSVLEGTDLNIPPELQGAADAILNDKKGDSVFPLLSWLMDEKKPGANGAALILAGIGGRKKLMRQLLGMKYANPEDIAELVQRYKPEGFKAWQPTPGQHLFTAKTVSEHVLDMFAEKLNEQTYPGVDKAELERALGQIKPQLVVGGDRYTMVIPSEIADTLTEWGDKGSHNQFLQAVAKLQGAWKQYTLVNPRRWFKYNFNNMTGDLDAIVAGKPGSLMKVPQAFRELYAISRGGAASDAYKEALERGVFQAGITRQEVPDIARFKGLRHLERQKSSLRPDRLAVQTVANIWGALKDSTQFRETLFRYATYLKYREEIAAGVDQAKIGYGGSNPALVDAVTDPADRAALLARELVGDYGNVSLFGQRMRRYVMPFWSWPEINTKRYYRLTANAFHTSYARGAAVGGALGVLTGARVGVSLMIRMALVFSLINLWNEWLHGDDEKKLDDQQQRQLHLILGHDSKGQVYTLKMQGALSDVLDELGFSDTVEAFHNYDQGKGSFAEILEATPKAIINRVGPGGWNPLYMEPIQLALREKLWPDMFQPRTIHDRTRDVAQTFSLENEYDALEHKPTQGYGQSWVQSFAYKRDPGEMAYNNTRDLIGQFLKEKEGLDIGRSDISPRSEALRDYKMALRFGDVDAAKRALQEYAKYDGSVRGLKESIKGAAPLHPLPRRDRAAFVASLDDEQRDQLIEAQRFYESVYLGVGNR